MKKVYLIFFLFQFYLNTEAQVRVSGFFGANAHCDGVFTSVSMDCSNSVFFNSASCKTLYGFAVGKCNGKVNQSFSQSMSQLNNLKLFLDFIEGKSKNEESFYKMCLITQEMLASIENNNLHEYHAILKRLQFLYEGLTEKNKQLINTFTENTFSRSFF